MGTCSMMLLKLLSAIHKPDVAPFVDDRSCPGGRWTNADGRTSYGRIEHVHRSGYAWIFIAALKEFVQSYDTVLVLVHFLKENISFQKVALRYEGSFTSNILSTLSLIASSLTEGSASLPISSYMAVTISVISSLVMHPSPLMSYSENAHFSFSSNDPRESMDSLCTKS